MSVELSLYSWITCLDDDIQWSELSLLREHEILETTRGRGVGRGQNMRTLQGSAGMLKYLVSRQNRIRACIPKLYFFQGWAIYTLYRFRRLELHKKIRVSRFLIRVNGA